MANTNGEKGQAKCFHACFNSKIRTKNRGKREEDELRGQIDDDMLLSWLLNIRPWDFFASYFQGWKAARNINSAKLFKITIFHPSFRYLLFHACNFDCRVCCCCYRVRNIEIKLSWLQFHAYRLNIISDNERNKTAERSRLELFTIKVAETKLYQCVTR